MCDPSDPSDDPSRSSLRDEYIREGLVYDDIEGHFAYRLQRTQNENHTRGSTIDVIILCDMNIGFSE